MFLKNKINNLLEESHVEVETAEGKIQVVWRVALLMGITFLVLAIISAAMNGGCQSPSNPIHTVITTIMFITSVTSLTTSMLAGIFGAMFFKYW